MKQYQYVGKEAFLMGVTALGLTRDGVFKVQVDQQSHPWAIHWHTTPRDDWKEIE